MTKRFRKTKHFETKSFIQDFERELIKDEEGDVFTLTGIERSMGSDEITESDDMLSSVEA